MLPSQQHGSPQTIVVPTTSRLVRSVNQPPTAQYYDESDDSGHETEQGEFDSEPDHDVYDLDSDLALMHAHGQDLYRRDDARDATDQSRSASSASIEQQAQHDSATESVGNKRSGHSDGTVNRGTSAASSVVIASLLKKRTVRFGWKTRYCVLLDEPYRELRIYDPQDVNLARTIIGMSVMTGCCCCCCCCCCC
jgi:hypothetical protein